MDNISDSKPPTVMKRKRLGELNPNLNYITAKKPLYSVIAQGKDNPTIAEEWGVDQEKIDRWVRQLCLEVYYIRFGQSSVDFDEETAIFLGHSELMLEADEGHLRNLSRGFGTADGQVSNEPIEPDASARLTKLAGAIRKQRIQLRQEVGALPSRLFKPETDKKKNEPEELPVDEEALQREIERLEEAEKKAKKSKNRHRRMPPQPPKAAKG